MEDLDQYVLLVLGRHRADRSVVSKKSIFWTCVLVCSPHALRNDTCAHDVVIVRSRGRQSWCVLHLRLSRKHTRSYLRRFFPVFGLGSATLCYSVDNWIKLQESKLALVIIIHKTLRFRWLIASTFTDYSQRKSLLCRAHRHPRRHIAHILPEVPHYAQPVHRVISFKLPSEFLH